MRLLEADEGMPSANTSAFCDQLAALIAKSQLLVR